MLQHSPLPLLKQLVSPLAALAVLATAAAPGFAQTAEEKGFEIAARSDRSIPVFGLMYRHWDSANAAPIGGFAFPGL